jgi:hypothetical protein
MAGCRAGSTVGSNGGAGCDGSCSCFVGERCVCEFGCIVVQWVYSRSIQNIDRREKRHLGGEVHDVGC